MKMRMGIHSGSCVGGVVGSKMPHFSVFGDTVNIAALMESTSEPMRVQISHTTMVCKIILSLGVSITFKELLEELGGFNCAVRGQMVVPRIGEVRPGFYRGIMDSEIMGIFINLLYKYELQVTTYWLLEHTYSS